jgi:hypothetical protein
MDFTNVGAPNNEVGTYFVATDTVPTSWGSKEGDGNDTISYNTGAPRVLKVLENTIGNIWYDIKGDGQYAMLSNSLFTDNSTFTTIGNDRSYTQGGTKAAFNQIGAKEGGDMVIQIESFTIDVEGAKYLQNDMMTLGTPLQVKVAL